MKKKMIIGLGIFAGILAVFLVVVALQPADYTISRSTTIASPPPAVFAIVNDFHHWNDWSPWAKLDPDARCTFEGPASGAGAVFTWSGNDKVGEGKMTITQSKPPEEVAMKLDFVRPFEDTANVTFGFKPDGGQTVVSWTMSGKNNFIGRIFCLFMDMDKMVGGDFERGLASLKALSEAGPTSAPATQPR